MGGLRGLWGCICGMGGVGGTLLVAGSLGSIRRSALRAALTFLRGMQTVGLGYHKHGA